MAVPDQQTFQFGEVILRDIRFFDVLTVDEIAGILDGEGDGSGMTPWEATLEFCRLLVGPLRSHLRTCVELGCGLGLPSLTIASLGIEVLATDRYLPCLQLLEQNVEANPNLRGLLRIQPYDWSVPGDLERRFDLVIGSEIAYDPDAFYPLFRSVSKILAPGGEFILLVTLRGPRVKQQLQTSAKENSFLWEELVTFKANPNTSYPSIVFKFSRS